MSSAFREFGVLGHFHVAFLRDPDSERAIMTDLATFADELADALMETEYRLFRFVGGLSA